MSKKRGLSYEEKRVRMQEVFFEEQTFFTLKEMEKIASKKKGIVLQSVKEVLQSLCDDALVQFDKVGTSNYFWCLPSQGVQTRQVKIASLEDAIEKARALQTDLKREKKDLQASRPETEDRKKRKAVYDELFDKNKRIKAELQNYADNDPELIASIRHDTAAFVDSANRWTDNIFNIRSYCTGKLQKDTADVDKFLGVGEDFDYIEAPAN